MKNSGTFIFAMTVTAGLFFAGRIVIGSGEAEVRPLAKSLGSATINDCRITGRIEGRTNGVFAVFDFENPTKQSHANISNTRRKDRFVNRIMTLKSESL